MEEGLSSFHRHSHAAWALVTDFKKIDDWNREVRAEHMQWVDGIDGWPDDEWIIGKDGFGNDYVVSKSGLYSGVHVYDHELRNFEPFQPSLRAYFDHCLDIERSTDTST